MCITKGKGVFKDYLKLSSKDEDFINVNFTNKFVVLIYWINEIDTCPMSMYAIHTNAYI